jgi:hypothetical protein
MQREDVAPLADVGQRRSGRGEGVRDDGVDIALQAAGCLRRFDDDGTAEFPAGIERHPVARGLVLLHEARRSGLGSVERDGAP